MAPISPKPNTAVPLADYGYQVTFVGIVVCGIRILLDSRHGSATPGEYASDKSR